MAKLHLSWHEKKDTNPSDPLSEVQVSCFSMYRLPVWETRSLPPPEPLYFLLKLPHDVISKDEINRNLGWSGLMKCWMEVLAVYTRYP